MHLLDRALERFLDQIVGGDAIALERTREPAQIWNVVDEEILKRGVHGQNLMNCQRIESLPHRGRPFGRGVPVAHPSPRYEVR